MLYFGNPSTLYACMQEGRPTLSGEAGSSNDGCAAVHLSANAPASAQLQSTQRLQKDFQGLSSNTAFENPLADHPKYVTQRYLSEGSFGFVLLAKERATGKKVLILIP